MSAFDLSVALTAHAETAIAGPTMRSAEAAIRAAEAAGFTVERLIGFDSPTRACRRYFSGQEFSGWKSFEFEYRDQGRTRNALVKNAQGRWIAYLDGDDLFSENWLSQAALMLAREGSNSRLVVHPEVNWVFDAGQFVFTKPAQDDPIFSPYYFTITNYYDALAVAPREVYMEHPFPRRAVAEGFAFEDWEWNIITMTAGWRHVIAPDTIIFKRRRDQSQTHESRDNSVRIRALEALAVDRLKELGKNPPRSC